MAVALGKRPSRRVLQEITKANTGTTYRTDEVHAFLTAWQFIGEDGRPHLRDDLGPVWVQGGSTVGPVVGPVAVRKTADLGPVKVATRVQPGSFVRADLDPERRTDNVLPPSANALGTPARQKPVKIQTQEPEVTFAPEDETRVAALMLERNPSGTVSPHVLARERAAMRSKLDAVGDRCWRYGVDTALAKPAGWRYALTVMANNPTGPPAPRPAARGAPPRTVPKNLQPDAAKMALYAQIGHRFHAVPSGPDSLDRLENATNPADART